jgi:putative DNA primase/helicase
MPHILKRFFMKATSTTPHKNLELATIKDQLDIIDIHSNSTELVVVPPKLRKEGLIGILGKISSALSNGTEASIEFIAAYLMVRFSSSIPRGYLIMPFGAFNTEPRINSLFVLGTGEGKGLAERQTNVLINTAIEMLENEISPYSGLSIYARVYAGGLSTSEGIAYELRDDAVTLKGDVQSGIDDKRLCVIETEYANLITKCNLNGSTLSITIRKLFDGDPIEPMTKTDRTSCKKPHVHIVGHITPEEFIARLDSVSIANGLANRLPIFSGIQQVYQPIPHNIDKQELQSHAKALNIVTSWCHQEKRTIVMSECYKQLWTEKYTDLKQIGAKGSIEQSLMTRAPHYAAMYAMIFAALDMSTTVTAKHLESSLAWIDYWHESVRYIFSTEADAFKAEQKNYQALDVLNTIKDQITKNNGQPITRTPLQQALGKKYNSKQLTELLKLLQELPMSPISVTKLQHNKQVISLT